MRTAGSLLVLTALALAGAGCVQNDPPDWEPEPTDDDGSWTTTDDGSIDPGCHADSDCSGSQVCAHDSACYEASAVRTVHVSWTLHGEHPTATLCSGHSTLGIEFIDASSTYWFGFAPVPCAAGRFTIDKLPRIYTETWMGDDYYYDGVGTTVTIPASNEATIDLAY